MTESITSGAALAGRGFTAGKVTFLRALDRIRVDHAARLRSMVPSSLHYIPRQ